jgi:hypothetical protein
MFYINIFIKDTGDAERAERLAKREPNPDKKMTALATLPNPFTYEAIVQEQIFKLKQENAQWKAFEESITRATQGALPPIPQSRPSTPRPGTAVAGLQSQGLPMPGPARPGSAKAATNRAREFIERLGGGGGSHTRKKPRMKSKFINTRRRFTKEKLRKTIKRNHHHNISNKNLT